MDGGVPVCKACSVLSPRARCAYQRPLNDIVNCLPRRMCSPGWAIQEGGEETAAARDECRWAITAERLSLATAHSRNASIPQPQAARHFERLAALKERTLSAASGLSQTVSSSRGGGRRTACDGARPAESSCRARIGEGEAYYVTKQRTTNSPAASPTSGQPSGHRHGALGLHGG